MPDFSGSFPVPDAIDFGMIGPILIVMITGVIALIMEVLNPKRNNNAIVGISVVGLVGAAVATVTQFGAPDGTTLVDMVMRDRFSLVAQFLLIVGAAMTILLSEGYLREKRIPFGEFYPLVLWSTSGAMLMATSQNLLVIFLGLEILSIALYVLAGMSRSETRSEESALKYFLLGAFASGFFLYGIAFFYGSTGMLDLAALPGALGDPNAKATLIFALGLMFVGLGFKSAFVPFHQWAPDVYQGAPTNVTAFMAVCSKIGAVAALYRVMVAAGPIADSWMPAMMVVAILTMVVGNVVALLQKDVKRILGYSSIANAGYILVGLLAHVKAPDKVPSSTVLYFLLAYAFMTMGAFAVLTLGAKDGRDATRLEDLRGMWKRNPWAAVLLLTFMVSLIGIPPTAGFFGKLFIFQDAIAADLTILAVVLAATSAVSVAYYLQVAWSVFVSDDSEGRTTGPLRSPTAIVCGICMAGVLLGGILFTPLTNWLMGTKQGETTVVVSR